MSSYFTLENCSSLNCLKPNDTVYILGTCGVAMAQLAVELLSRGFNVEGSDKEFYPPMSDLLKEFKIKTYTQYKETNIPNDIKLAIIGNSISRDNPELRILEERKIPYTIFPKVAYELLIDQKISIVFAGTHGKTTTTSLAVTVLIENNKQPSYFIGGITKGLKHSFKHDLGDVSVFEGDEYDSAFFAKVPKFFFYSPKIFIITSLEFDHADIYSSLEDIKNVFTKIVEQLDSSATLILCLDCNNLQKIFPFWAKSTKARVLTYGFNPNSDYSIVQRTADLDKQSLVIKNKDKTVRLEQIPLIGEHNARNILAVYIALHSYGLSDEQIHKGLVAYQGVKRRQEIKYHDDNLIIIEDFAHHPSAVSQTLKAIKENYPQKKIMAVFEPRSNSSRKKIFEKDYANSFGDADIVVIKNLTLRHNDNSKDLLDIKSIQSQIKVNKVCEVFDHIQEIVEFIKNVNKQDLVIVIMSNGSFDGLVGKLIACLSDPCPK